MFSEGLEVSEKLRAISYKFAKPVISAVQSNSEGMNNENIGMEHISQSRGVAFTADFLMALYQTTESRESGLIMGRILKNRLGGMVGKTISFELDPESLNLYDKTFDSDIPDSEPSDGQMKGILKSLSTDDQSQVNSSNHPLNDIDDI